MNAFIYSWSCAENDDGTDIKIYGIDQEGKNVALRVENFTPYAYIELPIKNSIAFANATIDEIGRLTIYTEIVEKRHLYSGYTVGNALTKFLFVQCVSKKQIGYISYALKTTKILGMTLKIHEESATSILQLASLRNIPMATWISFAGTRVAESQQVTVCEREYLVNWTSLTKSSITEQVAPKILAFDLEVNSETTNAMPSNKPGDAIFQISCVVHRANETRRKILLTLDGTDLTDNKLLTGIDTETFATEEDLLIGFIELLKRERPNVLTGYNILMFDIHYLIQRCERYCLIEDLCLAGYNRVVPAAERKIKWSSSAYKNQEYSFIDWEGILTLDLLPLVKRDYKLDNYKLDTVAGELIGAEKDPVSYKEIFEAYRTGQMARVGKYCVQDSNLCIDLLNHINCWISLSEMSVVCKVSMFSLYTQGQQLKVYSQVYDYCLRENIVVTSNGYECLAGERYLGAFVMDPVPGYYENVIPLDFCSLYPSLIIAHNICYSTFVKDESRVDKDLYETFEWEDHVGCEHDPKIVRVAELTQLIDKIDDKIKSMMVKRDSVKTSTLGKNVSVKLAKAKYQTKINTLRESQKPYRDERVQLKKGKPSDHEDFDGNVISGIVCAKRRYSFLKPSVKRGVMPTIIQNLLDSRKAVKLEMKTCDPKNAIVLDKKQLAIKVSANSQYGAMGVRRGYLPFMPGAMCITYLGREAIKKAGQLVCDNHGGKWVYTDTDSTYVIFPHLTSFQEIWDHAVDVSRLVSAEFPGAMSLEFEEAIYCKFLILSKKRYMYQSVNRQGVYAPKIGKKGIVLARRDNSVILRKVYELLVAMIFDKTSSDIIIDYVIETINDLFRNKIKYNEFIVTKSVGSSDGDVVDGRLGNYKVKSLPTECDEREKVLGSLTERQYAIKSCPAHIQLAERMRLRGYPIDTGSRMEYVVLHKPHARTLGGKIEDYEYFFKRKRQLRIDYLYYLKSMINPIDQLLKVGLGIDNFLDTQYDYRVTYEKIMSQIKKLGATRIVFKGK
jgi:DNA polymerase elongation subunit (family B)